MQLSLYLLLLLPVAWILLPQNNPASVSLAMAIAVVAGIVTLAWQISWTRYLFVNAVPEENKSAYLAVFYAWFAIVAGLGPFLAGQILSASRNLETQIWLISIDPDTPLFVLSFIFILIGAVIAVRLQTEGTTTFRHFAGMFLCGNPVKALRLLVQYNFSGDEMTRVVATEQMGDAQSLLSANELIEALRDPSFRVRQEAIHSIGRMPAEDELVDALIEVLEDPESELNISVARALGRIGSGRAILALRQALSSGYRPLEANSARSLAMLDDFESVPQIMVKLQQGLIQGSGWLMSLHWAGCGLRSLLSSCLTYYVKPDLRYLGARLVWLLPALWEMRSTICRTGDRYDPTSTPQLPRRYWPSRNRPSAVGCPN